MAKIKIPSIKIPKPKTGKIMPGPKAPRTGGGKAPSSPLTKMPKVWPPEPAKITPTEDTFKKWMKKKFK